MAPRDCDRFAEPLHKPLQALLEAVFGSRVTLVNTTVNKQDQDYLVLTARLRHPALEVMLKLAGPQAALDCPFERTAALLQRVASATTVPVSAIIAADTSYREWPWRYCIYERVPGVLFGPIRERLSPEERASVLRQLGDATAQLHGLRFPAFGSLTDTAQVEATASFLAAPGYLTALRERASAFIKAAPLRDYFMAAVERNSEWFRDVTEARLTHEDLHGWNILLAQQGGSWRLAAILDFDKAWAGHHESDLARMEFWDGMTGPEFWQGYTALRPVGPEYGQRRRVYQLFWCLEYAEFTARHLADTRRVCEALGLPAIENLEGLFGERR